MIRRTATAPSYTTGADRLLSPMIATSGALMMGVEAMPPSLPRLVTVMVEPASSSRVALLLRARSARRRISAAVSRAPAIGHCAPPVLSDRPSLRGDADVHCAVATNTPRAASYSTLHCGNESSTRVSAMTTSGRKVKLALSAGRDRFNCCRSDSSSVTSTSSTYAKCGDIALRLAHAFGDQATQADHLDFRRFRGRPLPWRPIPRTGRPQILTQNAPAGAGPPTVVKSIPASRARRRFAGDAMTRPGRSAGAAAASGVFAMGGAVR